ncbi:MAG: hypothetical protein A2Y91_06560 [Chloroflexi bacterium RBG_13_54_8]|nr:MAG: hypothetical protein A2Y91_06560 [Chloroflexi bacterium RBG_13_54_8]
MIFFRRPKVESEAERHYREALRYRDRKKREFDYGLCLWHFKQALKYEPHNPVFHCDLGRAYAAAPLLAVTRGIDSKLKLRESATLAIAEAKEALRIKPDYAEAYLILGEAHMYLGEKEKALQAFEAVLDLGCRRALRAYAEVESSQVQDGVSKRPDPDKAREHLERAVAYRNQGKYRLAEGELNRALKHAPDWPWVYRALCELA